MRKEGREAPGNQLQPGLAQRPLPPFSCNYGMIGHPRKSNIFDLEMEEDKPLFDDLSAEDIETISRHGIERRYPKSTVIISEGDCSDSLYIIREGRVKFFVSDESFREVTLGTQGSGALFGELALVDETRRSASVMTIEPSKLVMVTRPGFVRCINENPDLSIKLMRSLVKRIRSLTITVKNLALLDVYGRVTRLLVDLAEEREGCQVIEPRMTHEEMAKMVGSSREMVSRILKDLVDGGYLRVESKRLQIVSKFPARW